MSPGVLRLLSFVALGAVVPLALIYVLLIIVATPTATGGMEPIVAFNTYTAFTFIFGALIVVALNFSRQLAREAKGVRTGP